MNTTIEKLNNFLSFKMLIVLILIMYGLMRLYFYLVPTPNATVYVNSDSCYIVQVLEVQNGSCKISGNLRNDLLTDGYLLELANGNEVYLSSDVVSGVMVTSSK